MRCRKERGGVGVGWGTEGRDEEEGEGCTLSPHVASPTWLLFLSERRAWDRANKHWPPESPPASPFASLPAWVNVWVRNAERLRADICMHHTLIFEVADVYKRVKMSLHKMETTYCECHSAEGLRDTSPLCTIHPLTLKHSDNYMRASRIPTHDRTLPFIRLSQQFFSKHKSVGNCMVFHFTKSCVMDIYQKGKKQWVWFCRRSYSKKSFATTQ